MEFLSVMMICTSASMAPSVSAFDGSWEEFMGAGALCLKSERFLMAAALELGILDALLFMIPPLALFE